MQAYRNAASGKGADAQCMNRELFMKVDDDTFVSAHHFRQSLSLATARLGTSHLYAGVISSSTVVVRKNTSHWYEPESTWPNTTFPTSMFGGPGYILGKSIVKEMLDQKIPSKYMLWNEDKAVGVWIQALEQRGVRVKWASIPGSNGFTWNYPTTNGTWGVYPYSLHHHLSTACISCLAKLEKANAPNVSVHKCFQLDPLPEKNYWGV